MPAAIATNPWYKHLWPWIIIAILGDSVFLSLAMVTIAVTHPDTLVADNYYEAGKGINRSIDRETLAQTLKLRAHIQLDELTGEADVRLSGNSQPERLQLNLISPTQPEKDQTVVLNRSQSDASRYVGQLQNRVEGRRFVELLGVESGQTWRLFEEEHVVHDQPLTLGDEPLQGAQGSKN
ncbi:FixH family protein [Pseudomonas sp. CDFA 602]|uniref:FixH family protein n=1 Tax=Pseudomonas californiensis TaxID=2829823 RepID=UPI001E466D5F|nr:FixH family protein [Pseudomonas californiensis]MCD5993040.1 FixH family protein [Pseudomonas californiensis]MCD5998417.1 FixH family protein [Pseudomonas californiensis]